MPIEVSEIYSFYNRNIENWLSYKRIDVRRQYLSLVDVASGNYVLDVGCGCGIDMMLLSEMYDGISGVGIDFSQEAIRIAKKNVNYNEWELKCEDFRTYTSERKFDLIICSMLIMHYQDIRDIFHKLKELLASKGKILVVTNNPYLVAKDFELDYDGVKSIEYQHSFGFSATDVQYITKYLHPLSDYINKPLEEQLKLIKMKEISSYVDETLVFNPIQSNLPNFLVYVYE